MEREERIASYPRSFVRFLGTAGSRFIMLSQRRSSGGLWFSYGGAMGVIDPGPGSLVRICAACPQLSALDINTIILTHRHIDHSSDLNALVEGMTLRSAEKRGMVLLTDDCVSQGDSVLLNFAARKLKEIPKHADGHRTELSPTATVESVIHKHHGIQCYGLIFRGAGLPTWGIISDTAALPDFPKRYEECGMIVINTTIPLPRAGLEHMSLSDVRSLLQVLHPQLAILTHMGGWVLDLGPDEAVGDLSTEKTRVIAARDGMIVDLEGQNPIQEG
ncbi:MAG: MBL fold metallo-hydrolase [Synergistaceae bacterium]|nr:MBL fold metallo-hydrolase [Synergistaceae bacterium]